MTTIDSVKQVSPVEAFGIQFFLLFSYDVIIVGTVCMFFLFFLE